ncbi:MAG: glycoside hydrolase family 13 protein [Vitreoscilla sp.]
MHHPRQLSAAVLIAASSLGAAAPAEGAAPTLAMPAQIERIEPAFWWVGMKSDKLQLLVHGPRIADAAPQIEGATAHGVRIESVSRVANPNYLFIDLRIARDAAPGRVDIVFRHGDERFHAPFELRAREPGSAQRRGFDSSDVILNLVPDRFANGNPANDNVPGYGDEARRGDDEAGRHGGDIQGIVDHLDYFHDLGVTMLWPTPLTENKQPKYSYHGYASTDTYKIDPRFGSNEDYRRMVAAARAKGIGVILDVVLNHIGSEHWWMHDMPSPDWIGFDGRYVQTQHARTTASDPYASRADAKVYTDGWFGPHMPDMNQRNRFLATYQVQNAIWWIEYAGLSGLRVDTWGYSDQAFLQEWTRRVMAEYPNLNIVGEEWTSQPTVLMHWLGGERDASRRLATPLPSVMDFPLNGILRKALASDEDNLHAGLTDLYEGLVNDVLYPEPSKLVLFEGNHDLPRLYSVLKEDVGLTKMALAYVMTMPRVPQLYYGTEVLMTSPTVRDDGKARQDFPGGWAGDKVDAFTGKGLSAQQKDMQAFVRTLLNWRKTQTTVHRGKLMHFVPHDGTYTWFRYDADSTVMVVINKNRVQTELDLTRFAEVLKVPAVARDVLDGGSVTLAGTIQLPPRSVKIFEVR